MRTFLGAYPFASLGLCGETRLLGFGTGLIQGLPQTLQLPVQSRCGRSRIWRRHESSGGKMRIPERVLKPNAKLPRDFKSSKGFGMVAGLLMGGTIARDAELMEQLTHLARYDALKLETPEK